MTTQEMVKIIQAYEEGKELQSKLIREDTVWYDVKEPTFNFFEYEYRIKPKPKKYEITYIMC